MPAVGPARHGQRAPVIYQNFKRYKREEDGKGKREGADAGERPFGECDLDFIPMTYVHRTPALPFLNLI